MSSSTPVKTLRPGLGECLIVALSRERNGLSLFHCVRFAEGNGYSREQAHEVVDDLVNLGLVEVRVEAERGMLQLRLVSGVQPGAYAQAGTPE